MSATVTLIAVTTKAVTERLWRVGLQALDLGSKKRPKNGLFWGPGQDPRKAARGPPLTIPYGFRVQSYWN